MKCVAAFVVAVLVLQDARAQDVSHPVGKVIRMLTGLSTKVEFDAKAEALVYEKFVYWCTNSKKELSEEIAKSEEEVETLTDSIAGKEQQEKTLTEEIGDLGDEIAAYQADQIAANKVRLDTAGVYTAAMLSFKSTLTAIADAIKLLDDSKTLPTFSQVLTKPAVRTALVLLEAVAPHKSATIAAFVQGAGGAAAGPAPAPYGYAAKDRPDLLSQGDLGDHVQKYAFKSDNVIELLRQLQLKFQDEERAAEIAETNSLNAFALAKQARAAAEKAADDSQKEKTLLRGSVQGELHILRSDLFNANSDLDADRLTLTATEKSCTMKAAEWEERSATREQEREAMAMAIKILAEVSGVRTDAPDNPVMPAAPTGLLATSFLQVNASSSPQEKVMSLLRSASRTTHSKALARLADQLAIEPHGHFGAVINSIEKMIFKLADEQMAEDKHKAWCDEEEANSKASWADKHDKIHNDLQPKLNVLQALIIKLGDDITDAEDMVADITGFMQEATEIRQVGKKENKISLKDAEDAQDAVARATAVLEDFYKSTGMVAKEAWEFVQQPVTLSAKPSTWGASYNGLTDPLKQPSGIVSVLQRVAADFAKMEADTRAQEATDQQEYDDQMSKSTIDKARRNKEADMKSLEKKKSIDEESALEKRKKHVQEEKDAVSQYMKDLKPACSVGTSSYDDRKAARDQEIAALHEAQSILADAFKTNSTSFLSVRRHSVF